MTTRRRYLPLTIHGYIYLLVSVCLAFSLVVGAFLFWRGNLYMTIGKAENQFHLGTINHCAAIKEELQKVLTHLAEEAVPQAEEPLERASATLLEYGQGWRERHAYLIQASFDQVETLLGNHSEQAADHPGLAPVMEKLQRFLAQITGDSSRAAGESGARALSVKEEVSAFILAVEQLKRLHQRAYRESIDRLQRLRKRDARLLILLVAGLTGLGAIIVWRVSALVRGILRDQERTASQLRAREATLLRNETRHRAIIANTAEGFALFSIPNAVIQAVNPALCRMLRAEEQRLVGCAALEFVHRESRAGWMALERSIAAGTMETFRARLVALDGTEVHIQAHGAPLPGEPGAPEAGFAFITDMTAHQTLQDQIISAKEAAESASFAKSSFLAHMSHEIRTPLNAILGMGELLLETDLTGEQRQFLAASRKAGESLLALISDILDLSKIEADQLDLEEIVFDLPKLMGEAVEILKVQARDKPIVLEVRFDSTVPDQVKGDANRVRQLLLNLGGNAIKFTHQGQIILAAEPGLDERVRFVVSDTGIGIEPEKLHAIFDPFTQADYSFTRQYGGAGLGLTICARLIERMGGEIRAESVLGRGSRFQFEIPLPPALDEVLEPLESAIGGIDGAADGADGGGQRAPVPPPAALGETAESAWAAPGLSILLAEDAPDNRLLFQAYLKDSGHRITMAENGLEAVDRFISGGFDLVVMDIQMPLMDGYSATREIRAWERMTGAAHTPIIALTAHAMQEAAEQSLAVGCDLHLTKPITKNRFLDALGQFASSAASPGAPESPRV